jgi:hypothetical protein
MATQISVKRYQFSYYNDLQINTQFPYDKTSDGIYTSQLQNTETWEDGLNNSLYCYCRVPNSWLYKITQDNEYYAVEHCSDSFPDTCGPPATLGLISKPYIIEEESTLERAVWNCIYQVEDFTKRIQLTDFVGAIISCPNPSSNCPGNGFTVDPKEAQIAYDTVLLPSVCGRTSNNCTNGASSCSMFLDAGELGAECRVWQDEAPEISDAVKETFCLENQNNSECKCILRTNNPEYAKLRVNQADYCWYIPCSNDSNTLKLHRDEVNAQNCGDYCATIFNFIDSTDINFSAEFLADIDCNFSSSVTSSSTNNFSTSSTSTSSSPSFWDEKWIALTVVAGGIGLFILIVVVIMIVVLKK